MSEKTETNRQKQAEETKNRIYRAAIELLEHKGFENITIAEISRKADVSVGAFYLYFSSKKDILSEVFNKADIFFSRDVLPLLSGKTAPEQIIEYFIQYVNLNLENGVETTKHLFSPNVTFFIQKERPMHDILVGIIRKGQEKGELRTDVTPDELERLLFVNAWGTIFEWNLHNGKFDLKSTMEKRMGIMLSTLLPPA